jgi:ParB family chromosome partitioning protein
MAEQANRGARSVAKYGANMAESIGQGRAGGAAPSFAPPTVPTPAGRYLGTTRIKAAMSIELDRIVADPDQPRKEFDRGSLDELAASLRSRGQLQPILVRWSEPIGKWVVIAGERRLRAAGLAGLSHLKAIEDSAEKSAHEILQDQLVENCVREDLKPVEQAHAFRTLMDVYGWSHRQLADNLHLSKSMVTKALALLDLAPEVQDRVDAGDLAPSVAYEVARLPDPDAQREAAREIVEGGLTRVEAAAVVARRRSGPAEGPARPKPVRYDMPEAVVSVTLKDGSGSHDLVIAALESALKRARGERRRAGAA